MRRLQDPLKTRLTTRHILFEEANSLREERTPAKDILQETSSILSEMFNTILNSLDKNSRKAKPEHGTPPE